MRSGEEAAVKPLTRCPLCAGRLIYPRDLAGVGGSDADVVLSRRCPECEHRDLVVTACRTRGLPGLLPGLPVARAADHG